MERIGGEGIGWEGIGVLIPYRSGVERTGEQGSGLERKGWVLNLW